MLKIVRIMVIAVLSGTVVSAGQSETDTILRFQRAADTYAFQHRQAERRLGGEPDAAPLARAINAARPLEEGEFFTPLAGAVFRARIDKAVRTPQCPASLRGSDFRVPRVNEPAAGTTPLPSCVAAVLPKLPAELEYHAAGTAMLLVDVHANRIIDVLHAAIPVRDQ